MIRNFKNYLLEKTVWPKIYSWKTGQDLAASKVLNSINGVISQYIEECIDLGLIQKMLKTSHSAKDKDLVITLKNDTEYFTKLYMNGQGATFDNNWKENSGLKALRDVIKKSTLKIFDMDNILSLTKYQTLISEYDMSDVSTDRSIKSGYLIFEYLYKYYKLNYVNKSYQYKMYLTGEVTENEKGDSYIRKIKQASNITSYKDLDASFDLIIKTHLRHLKSFE